MPSIDSELDAVHAFAAAARAFCAIVENNPDRSGDSRAVAKAVAGLISGGLDLPGDLDEDAPELPSHADTARGIVLARFAELSSVVYFDVFDPLASPPEEPVENSLVDDLGDLYLDLKRGLLLYDAGHVRAAGWDWNFHFWIHWGEHASGALRAFYWKMRNARESK